MARTLVSSLVVQIRDLASAPARSIAQSIKGIGAAVSAANTRNSITAMTERNNATLGLSYAWKLLIKGSLLTVLKPLATITKGFGVLATTGLWGMLRPMRLVTRGLGILRGALLMSGIGALLVAIGAAGKFISDNWSGLGIFFREFSKSLTDALGADGSKIQPILNVLKDFGEWMAGGSWRIDDKTWAEWGRTLGQDVAPTVRDIISSIERLMTAAKETGKALDDLFSKRDKASGKKPEAGPALTSKPGQEATLGQAGAGSPPTPTPTTAPAGPMSQPTGAAALALLAHRPRDVAVPPTEATAATPPEKPGRSFWSRFEFPKFDGAWDGITQMLASTLKNEIPAIVRAYQWVTDDARKLPFQERTTPSVDGVGSTISKSLASFGEWLKAPIPKATPTAEATAPSRPVIGLPPGGPANENMTPTPSSDAGAKLEQLNQPAGPGADLTGLAKLNAALDQTQAKIDRLNRSEISIGVGGGLVAGGTVNRQVRAGMNDGGM